MRDALIDEAIAKAIEEHVGAMTTQILLGQPVPSLFADGSPESRLVGALENRIHHWIAELAPALEEANL